MKFNIFSLLVVLSTVFLAACNPFAPSLERIGSLSFTLDVSEGVVSETTLVLEPDYELRSLKVTYSKDYAEDNEGSPYVDIDTEGVLGGVFFDQFENVLAKFSDESFKVQEEAGSIGFSVTVLPIIEGEGSKRVVLLWDDEDVFTKFFLDVSERFNIDTY